MKNVRVVSKTDDKVVVTVRAPTESILRDMVSILGLRNHTRLQSHFRKTYADLQPEVYETFQTLAWAAEYCRYARVPLLEVRPAPVAATAALRRMQQSLDDVFAPPRSAAGDAAGDASDARAGSRALVLDCKALLFSPKNCAHADRTTLRNCSRAGIISCSRCLIASWCSEDCLLADYVHHQPLCEAGFRIRQHLLRDG